MLSIKFDSKGTKKIKWPGNDLAIVEAAENLLKAEMEMSDAERFPKINLLRKTLKDAEDALGLVALEEGSPIMNENDAFKIAKEFARTIVAGLTYFHSRELPRLEEWGVHVVEDKPQTPTNKKDVAEMLRRFVEKEESLDESNRLPSPPFAQVSAITSTLLAALERREEKKKRAKGRPEEVRKLFDLLQLAAAFHVVVNFDGVVDRQLEKLGFEIVEVPPKKPKPAKEQPEPEGLNES